MVCVVYGSRQPGRVVYLPVPPWSSCLGPLWRGPYFVYREGCGRAGLRCWLSDIPGSCVTYHQGLDKPGMIDCHFFNHFPPTTTTCIISHIF